MIRTLFAPFALLATSALAAEWTYTNGAGRTATLPAPSSRIIAQANAAAAPALSMARTSTA